MSVNKRFLAALAIILGAWSLAAAPGSEAPRIVLLGDPHLPYKTTATQDPERGARLASAKEAAFRDINGWKDLTRIVALGDIVGTTGSEEEYRLASGLLAGLTAPLVPITGNHDYIYRDETRAGRLVRGSSESRREKLERFLSSFHLASLQREESLAGYELIYLSTDSSQLKHQVGLSEASLRWLDETLARTSSLPTIIFFHAPLAGTLLQKGKPSSASSEAAAQPAGAIDAILRRNPQVFLWVSGHTHTSPSNPSFASARNLYGGRITDIHCGDLDHLRIYTNSLWLYPGQVVVRTFDHGSQSFLADKDRTIQAP